MKKTLLIASSLATLLNAQTLQTTVEEVLATNPIIQERLKNYNLTKEDITSAKSGYYPKLDLSLGVGYEDSHITTKQRNLPKDIKNEHLSVYQNSLTYTQNLFKGFETTHQVAEQEHRTVSSAYSYIEKVNDTSFEMVNTYLLVMKNKELLETARENVEINEEIFTKVQKLYDAGLTTLSEVNKIESSLSLAKSNFVVQENTLMDVNFNMQRVLGRYLDVEDMTRPVLHVELPNTIEEAAQYSMKNNPSLLVSKYNIKLAQSTYQEKKSPFYPQVDIEVSQNMNKNLSGIEGTNDRFRAMAYVKYNFFNGFADQAELQKSVSTIHKEVELKNSLRRQVIEGLNLSWAANKKLDQQLAHLKDYKKFSFKTLSLYSKEYDLGRRSLLDLLSAQNDFIGAKSQIINNEYSMLFAKYRILDAMGILVSSITEDTDIVYSNVGLVGRAPENTDTLPIKYDLDNDLVVDEKDICANSLSTEMKSIYGCKSTFGDTDRIERYTKFLFADDSSVLTQEGEKNLNDLIKQIKEYGFENMSFEVLGNVDVDGISKEDAHKLSTSRAEAVEAILIKAGALKSNITIYAQSNEAPLYSTEKQEGVELNNRVDIVVRKLKL